MRQNDLWERLEYVMRPEKKKDVLRRLALMVWAFATLILCFILVLLVNHMLGQGKNPLEALNPESDELAGPDSGQQPDTSGVKEITLYFASPSAENLSGEIATIEYGPVTLENCRAALQKLVSGPRQGQLLPIMPQDTRIRALYLKGDNELIVDVSSEILLAQQVPRSIQMEALMFYGIVNTLVQPELQGNDGKSVAKVRFLFDGMVAQESFPAHMDISAPLTQDPAWIQAES